MIVFSKQCIAAGEDMRSRGVKIGRLKEPITVTPDQLETAGHILAAGPQPIANGIKADMPGFLEPDQQEADEVLLLQVGILPSRIYHIQRDGTFSGECDCRDDHASWCEIGQIEAAVAGKYWNHPPQQGETP